MQLDQTPKAAKIDIPTSALSMVNFSQSLMELIMVAAGNTNVRSGRIRSDLFVVGIGTLRFEGETSAQAFKRMLFWLLTKELETSAEEYAAHAHHVLDMEDEDTKSLIEELTKDGMSEFGQKVQAYRTERGSLLSEALSSIEKDLGHLPSNIDTLQDELQRRTGYEDLDAQEILIAVVDQKRMQDLIES